MTRFPSPESTVVLRDGFGRAGLTTEQLWLAALGIGGEMSLLDIEAITSGERPASRGEHDILAAALNDHFVSRGEDHPVAGWSDIPTAQ
jgi:hypothetical protein